MSPPFLLAAVLHYSGEAGTFFICKDWEYHDDRWDIGGWWLLLVLNFILIIFKVYVNDVLYQQLRLLYFSTERTSTLRSWYRQDLLAEANRYED
ncbi:hypothetical protein [Sphingobacterium faecale]|uniref:Uncharacterized protein n=1 Tax=Sphingobacterium faecale TaxID=2803775 RepID=A0ABS1QZS2_9SPHI|nr:hypothetical protein [Sphingobacterium faecale]MBL1407514.1 hypothetical protein [Sphingobacterium faecale]